MIRKVADCKHQSIPTEEDILSDTDSLETDESMRSASLKLLSRPSTILSRPSTILSHVRVRPSINKLSTNSTDISEYHHNKISTKNVFIQPYDAKSRRKELCNECCINFVKIMCSACCIIMTCCMLMGVIIGSYLYIKAIDIPNNGYPLEPAAFIGILTLIGLFAFGCCIICTWFSIDILVVTKKKCKFNHLFCCYCMRHKDKDDYYKNEWNSKLLECNKIDYVINYYCGRAKRVRYFARKLLSLHYISNRQK
eukprot:333933_1